MHQLGWLHAKVTGTEATRLETLQDHIKRGWATDIGLPVIDAGQYLITALAEAGTLHNDPMGGQSPLGWPDIWAYAQATGAIDEPWEMQCLRDMSMAYCRGLAEGVNPLSMPPVERGGVNV